VKILDLSKATGITGEARHGFRLSCPTVETLVLPQRLKKIPYTAFLGCGSLCSVTIPAATTSIGECAFEDTNLTTVVFEAAQSFSVITGKYAKVVDDVLLENVSDTDIELHDFRGSNDLEMWEWREYKGFRGPFNGCDNLSKIEVPFSINLFPRLCSHYWSRNGVLGQYWRVQCDEMGRHLPSGTNRITCLYHSLRASVPNLLANS